MNTFYLRKFKKYHQNFITTSTKIYIYIIILAERFKLFIIFINN